MIVAAARASGRRGTTLPARAEWFIEETIGLISGTRVRVWHPNPRMMDPRSYKEDGVGYWTTEDRKR